MKRAMFLAGGICWLLFALGFVYFLVQYLAQGAGSQFFGPLVSSASIFTGVLHVIGLVAGSVLCFAVGAGLWARGSVSEKDKTPE